MITTMNEPSPIPQPSSQKFDIFNTEWSNFIDRYYSAKDPIGEVLHYILESPGKRVRAQGCLLTAALCHHKKTSSSSARHAMNAAIAIEMVHAYSLVHDDLPCMDDDTMRRGRQTAHVKFDEARALLAGDGLLTDAFAVLTQSAAESSRSEDCKTAAHLVTELAQAAGSRGMVRGQSLDLFWTGRPGAELSDLIEIHSGKTAWLLGASCAMGAIAAEASADVVDKARLMGRYLGLAFQIVDDLIDHSAATGKTPGKDELAGKLTYVSIVGIEDAQKIATDLSQQALKLLNEIDADQSKIRGASADNDIGHSHYKNYHHPSPLSANLALTELIEQLLHRKH